MTRIKTIQNIKTLIERCKNQEENAQKLLFEQFAGLVFTTCRRYSTSSYPAKDLLQDTFIKVFEKIHSYDEKKGKLESWIIRIAINLALNAIRDNKLKFVNFDSKNTITDQSDEIRSLFDLSEEEILQKIEELPLGYRTVFNLYVFNDFSHKAIAKELDISVSTSKTQLYKAKKMLQTKITHVQKKKYGGF